MKVARAWGLIPSQWDSLSERDKHEMAEATISEWDMDAWSDWLTEKWLDKQK